MGRIGVGKRVERYSRECPRDSVSGSVYASIAENRTKREKIDHVRKYQPSRSYSCTTVSIDAEMVVVVGRDTYAAATCC